jgi:serine/threonine-protein kinase RsbW
VLSQSNVIRFFAAATVSAAGIAVAAVLEPVVGPEFFAAPLLGAVAVTVWLGGVGPALWATALCTFASTFFLIEPRYSIDVGSRQDLVRWVVFLAVALLITALGRALIASRDQAERDRDFAEQRRLRLERLQTLTAELSRSATAADVGTAFLRHAVPGLGMRGGVLMLVDRVGRNLELVAAEGMPPEAATQLARLPLDKSIAICEAARTHAPVLAETGEEWRQHYLVSPDWFADSPASSVGFPLLDRGRLLGAVGLIGRDGCLSAKEDVDFISTVVSLCAQAVKRTELVEAEHQARRRAELLAEIVNRLQTVETVHDRAELLLTLLVPRVADYGSVEMPSERRPVLAVAHRDGSRLQTLRALRERHRVDARDPHSVAHVAGGEEHLIREITPELLAGYSNDEETGALLERLAPRSHMALPLRADGRVFGVLLLGLTEEDRRPYTQDDVAYLREVATRAGLLLSNARLTEQEREISRQLQHAMLPHQIRAPAGVVVRARYEAGHERLDVGGDWYEAITLPGERVALCVGDVVGHGVRAAAAMGQLRSAVVALAPVSDGPADLLERLDAFAAGVDGAYLATVCYLELQAQTGQVRYACAGHPPPLVIHRDRRATYLEGGRSAPLGARGSMRRAEDLATLEPGSTLLVYSDGLYERRGESLDAGFERLRRVAMARIGQKLDVLCDGVVDDMMGDAGLRDDVALVCARLTDVGAG